jgi:hypothetical protein
MNSSIKVACAALAFSAVALSGAQRIQVQVDGTPVAFQYGQPQYINGRVLVPLRGVFEQMGATVSWDPQTRLVSANRNGSDVQLRIGDRLALVNGTNMNLDVPAMIIGGSTMVPIRFLSEALGAQVGWFEAQHLVSINTTLTGGYNPPNNATITSQPRRLRRIVVRENEIIPVILDHTLTTIDNKRGDKFTATVRMEDGDTYGEIPKGTKIEGHIAAVHPRRAGDPAILDLAFDRLRFPNGRSVRIDGQLTSLDGKNVRRDANGVLMATGDAARSGTDQRLIYAGYGAGAGLLVGVLTKKPLEGAILGGALGYIFGQVQKDQRAQTTDITLRPGTEMGVKINNDVAVSW